MWGIPATGSITVWVPIMVFAFLFGLSMDYEVFILSRTREAYDNDASASTRARRGGRTVSHRAARDERGVDPVPQFPLDVERPPDTDVKVLATGPGGRDPARRRPGAFPAGPGVHKRARPLELVASGASRPGPFRAAVPTPGSDGRFCDQPERGNKEAACWRRLRPAVKHGGRRPLFDL